MSAKRTKPQREADAHYAWELYQSGYSQSEIAKILNARAEPKIDKETGKIIEAAEVDYTLTQQEVSYDINSFKKSHIEKNPDYGKKAFQTKNLSILQLDLVIKQSFKQFELGKQERKKSKVTTEKIVVDGKDLPDMPEIYFDDMELIRKRAHTLPGEKLKKILQKNFSLSDPRFLFIIIAAIEQKNKLLGNYPEAISEDKPDDSSIDNLCAALERSRKKHEKKNES